MGLSVLAGMALMRKGLVRSVMIGNERDLPGTKRGREDGGHTRRKTYLPHSVRSIRRSNTKLRTAGTSLTCYIEWLVAAAMREEITLRARGPHGILRMR